MRLTPTQIPQENRTSRSLAWVGAGIRVCVAWLVCGPGCFFLLADSAHSDAPSGYYDSVDGSSAEALREDLHARIEDHQRFPYTSTATDTWDVLELADEDPDDGSAI